MGKWWNGMVSRGEEALHASLHAKGNQRWQGSTSKATKLLSWLPVSWLCIMKVTLALSRLQLVQNSKEMSNSRSIVCNISVDLCQACDLYLGAVSSTIAGIVRVKRFGAATYFHAKHVVKNHSVLSSEMLICGSINERVDCTAQIDQETVCKVSLSGQSGFAVGCISVVDDAHWKPTTSKTSHHCC